MKSCSGFLLCVLTVLMSGCASNEPAIKVFVVGESTREVNRVINQAYREMDQIMQPRTGFHVDVERGSLVELDGSDAALLHLVGTQAVELDQLEIEAVRRFLDTRGTVLIENLNGAGKFVDSLSKQFEEFDVVYGSHELVSIRSNVITGRNLPDGSTRNRRLVYRGVVLKHSNPDNRLLLRGYLSGDRMDVYLSYEDLSLGTAGIGDEQINGYSIKNARSLMVNILLEAHKYRTLVSEQTP